MLFRLVNDGLLLSELQRARSPYLHPIPPPHRGVCRLHSTPLASFHQTPMALAPASAMLPQAPMHGAPSHNSIPALKPTTAALKSGLRHTASRGREIASGALCHALANKLPVGSAGYADTPVRCSLIQSSVPLAAITFIAHRLVITAHRRHSTPLLDKEYQSKGERLHPLHRKITNDFPTPTAAI